MPHRFGRLVVFGLAIGASWNLAAVEDPLAPLLDGRPPEIVRVLPAPEKIAPGIAVERIVFRSHDSAEVFALIARPLGRGPHPGLLVLHGGGGSAEVEKARALRHHLQCRVDDRLSIRARVKGGGGDLEVAAIEFA